MCGLAGPTSCDVAERAPRGAERIAHFHAGRVGGPPTTVYVSYAPPAREASFDARRRLLTRRPRLIEQTSRLLTVKELRVRVVAVGQPREVLTTITVAGYLLPVNGNNP